MAKVETPEELILYLKESSLSQAPKTQIILRILLENPDGVLRCCLRQRLKEANIDIGQPAAQVRQLRSSGINIPQLSKVYCHIHKAKETIDKIEIPYLTGNDYLRISHSPKDALLIRKAIGPKDAFTGIKVSTALEIDHRIPVARKRISLDSKEIKVDSDNISEIKNRYQALTRENNLYKSRICEKCVREEVKPAFFLQISIPESIGGGKSYIEGENDCSNCPFAHPEVFLNKVHYID